MQSHLYDRRFTINAPDVVSEDFSGQTVILNLSDGRYFSLGGIASPVWNLLVAGQTPQAIYESLGASRPELVDDAGRFVDRLLELNLVRLEQDDSTGPMVAITESWAGDSPQIEVFDDLAELIFADPIHDVDEQAGWPAPPGEPQTAGTPPGS